MEFVFKKKYGQNFITDKSIINRIAMLIEPKEDDLIIEIGPGAGALTSKLYQYNTNYLAYEIDTDLDKYLSRYDSSKFKVIYDDFLKRDIKKDIKDIKYNNLYIVVNLPYYITTNILLKIVEEELDVERCIFMVQKEFGDRLTASPKTREYGSITVLLSYYFDINKEFIVTKDKFQPKPNVDSIILSFDKKDKEVINTKQYKMFIRDCFQFKRKTLKNNLKGHRLEDIEKVLVKHGYSLANRPEEIPYLVYVDIVKTIFT